MPQFDVATTQFKSLRMPVTSEVTRPDGFIEFRKESILQGIHQRVEEQVRRHPGNVALRTAHTAYTYAEMNGFANSIGEEILSASGQGLAQAAILQPTGPEMIFALLASLKAHKAYVPLDPKFPKERLQFMLEDAEAVVLLTDDQHMGLAEELAKKQQMRIINTCPIGRDPAAPNPEVSCDPLERAYILYTSGSTGRPKGIAFLHRNLLHHVMCMTNCLYFSSSDRVSWLHSASFSASVVDIYCCLTNGATLYPWDAKTQGFTGMADWLIQGRLTTFQWIPSAFRQLLRTVPEEFVCDDIRIVVLASEPLTVREVELFRRHFPVGSHLVNQVGTSESYNYRLYWVNRHTPIRNAIVPGGYSVSEEREVLILDNEHHPLPHGTVGEIGVRSEYMSAGYWRDERLTRSRFVRIGTDKVPVYLTGDLGRLEPDGCLIHLGRKDLQVKIRGYRVELAEIDHVLAGAPGVADSAAWVAKNRLGEDQLVGYVVLKTPGQFNQPQVERHLESRLPDYMVPRHYVIVDCFPTLPTGKVDRTGLPNPFHGPEPGTKRAALTLAPLEEEVVNLFGELLQMEHATAALDFFEQGGDSLLTAVLMESVRQRFHVEIAVDDFLETPTPRHVASLINRARENGGSRPPRRRLGSDKRKTSPLVVGTDSLTAGVDGIGGGAAQNLTSRAPVPARGISAAPKTLVIITAGQLGREVFTWAAQAIAAGAPWRIKGFLDSRADALDGYNYDVKVLGDMDSYEIDETDVFIGAVGDPIQKVKCYSPIIQKGGRFINLIHPLANIGNNVQLGTGIVMAPFSSITSDLTVGDHVSIGALSNVGHDTVIGDWCQISSHCGINGRARLGEGVFLGSHACIIPGIEVGEWAFVGAGSVVVRDVPPRVKVFGNPAAPIGRVQGV